VKRFILLSSIVSVVDSLSLKDDTNHVWNENDWNDDENTRPYSRGKTLGEREMWDFAKEHPQMEYVSILPGMVLGPILDSKVFSTTENVYYLLNGKFFEEGIPNNKIFSFVDVRDVSEAILKAIKSDESNGNRYLVSSRAKNHLLYIANIIKKDFPGEFNKLAQNFKDPKEVPFTTENYLDNSKVIQLLGHDLIPIEQTVRDTIQSFRDYGMI